LLRGALVATFMLFLPGCGLFGDDGPVRIAAIGELTQMPDPSRAVPGTPGALLLDATARGLVAHDSDGQIEAGLADRWTVIDNGLSYIFRLREAEWDGRRVNATDVAWGLGQRMQARDLPMALRGEFDAVESVRGMTAKVIEIRLSRPLPHFLDLLAHPAMSLRRRNAGWGPLRAERAGRAQVLTEAPDPMMLNAEEETVEPTGPLAILWGTTPAAALAQFANDEAAAVLGGRFESWPYLAAADINGPVIRRDPVDGLFGLAVVDGSGLLGNNLARDAVAMAIDRAVVGERLGVPQWTARTTLRSARAAAGSRGSTLPEPIYPAWIDLTLEQRRVQARSIVARFADRGTAPRLRIALPQGPGASILFAQLKRDLAIIGITLVRVRMASNADLRLIDEVAPSDDPLWYLRRLGCQRGLLCDPAIEPRLAALTTASDPAARNTAVAAADEALTRYGNFIPLAAPLRWSLVNQRLAGYRPNGRGQHSVLRLLPPPE
jgi:peptide/nickel transport system substrate-binding protein